MGIVGGDDIEDRTVASVRDESWFMNVLVREKVFCEIKNYGLATITGPYASFPIDLWTI